MNSLACLYVHCTLYVCKSVTDINSITNFSCRSKIYRLTTSVSILSDVDQWKSDRRGLLLIETQSQFIFQNTEGFLRKLTAAFTVSFYRLFIISTLKLL